LLMYTSGTTGTPKGVLLSHANLLASAHTVADWHQLTARDRVLSSLPLYHINGQVIATLTPFLSGGSIVAPHRFSVHQWWDLVAQHECTWINMVPTIIAYLLAATEARSFPSVRFGRSASAPLPPEQHRAFEERFGIPVIEAMGMTECASIVFCNPHDDRRRYGSPGLPCGVEASVIDKTGRHLGTGEAGEIVLRGPNVMAGYFKSPEKTAETIDENGWLRTGDLGKRDEDGFYFITGRLKELIIKGGENIAPRDIDEALLRHPAIMEAAAVGVPHPAYGQDVAAAIVLHPGARFDRDEFARWCEEELGRFRAPTCVRVVKEMPKGPSGKVQRLKLVQLFVDDEITATKRDDRPNA
jgi:acyl-CoA synthetase (AMP-forming)/AMP-acid ligase II